MTALPNSSYDYPLRAVPSGAARRRIVQFQVCPNGKVVALCSDGTLWMGGLTIWQRFISIPQDEPTLPNTRGAGQ